MITLVFLAAFEVRGFPAETTSLAAKTYEAMVALVEKVTERSLDRTERSVVIEAVTDLRAHDAGASSLGRVRLREDGKALAHELAHQVLLAHCPQASDDKLFHEAFALSASGELDAWLDEGYFSSVKADKLLRQGVSVDTTDGRRALARLIADGKGSAPLPVALVRRLRTCVAGAPWQAMVIAELSSPAAPQLADAFVVLSRHSGEVLQASGEAQLQMPFGSVLKPFIVAAADPPSLPVDARDPLWQCGGALPAKMSAREALPRSCNGYFLAWGKQAPGIARYGAFGEVLLALGLERLPAHVDEAMGLRPTLALSAWQIAQAYRVLAEARPDVLDLLAQTAVAGTLAELPVSATLSSFALKTGTVRDPQNNVELGWIVAVSADVVAVMARKGKMPRTFAHELKVPAGSPRARVQVFGLLDLDDVEADCQGVPVELDPLSVKRRGFVTVARSKRLMCLGQPFSVRFPGITPRPYPGMFTRSEPPPNDQPARRGSALVFSTTLARYVAGVLASEDAAITGEARVALARVIAHNATHASERHPGRPPCDTTHCQVFQGAPKKAEITPVAPWLDARGWLPFSRGGTEPWEATVPLAAVTRALGETAHAFSFSATDVRYAVYADEVEEWRKVGCERVRGPLKLPSCPQRAERRGDAFVFSGVGKGHGLGLDVEAAKATSLDAEALLRRAYGSP